MTPMVDETTPVEDLLLNIETIDEETERFELVVPEQLTYRGQPVPADIAMAILLDRILAKGLFPNGFRQDDGARTYFYDRER